jgi:hypothetical protein
MGILMLLSLGMTFLVGFPLITYKFAKEKGRDAKTWLIIGILLPGLATLVLSLLPDKPTEEKSKKV